MRESTSLLYSHRRSLSEFTWKHACNVAVLHHCCTASAAITIALSRKMILPRQSQTLPVIYFSTENQLRLNKIHTSVQILHHHYMSCVLKSVKLVKSWQHCTVVQASLGFHMTSNMEKQIIF